MSDKQTQIDKEKVSIGCYISLALAIVFFSGIAAGSSYFWSFLDFTTLMGSTGKVVGKMMFGLRDTLERDSFLECVAGLEKLYEPEA